jgi:hypothetical protein
MPLRTFLSLLLLSSVLTASQLDQIKTLYAQQAYQECIDQAMASGAYHDAKIQWYWALSAEALGDNDAAISAYERVLMLEPGNAEASVRLATLFEKMQMQGSAQSVAEEAEAYALSPSQRATLNTLKDKRDLSDTAVRLRFRVGHDSNVNFAPGSEKSMINQNGATVQGDAPMSSAFMQLEGDVTYKHELSEPGGWYLRSDLSLFGRENFQAHRYDSYFGKLYAGPGLKVGDLNLYAPLYYDRMHFLEHDFLQEYGVRPELSWLATSEVILTLYGDARKQRYLQESYKDADSEVLEGGLQLTWLQSDYYLYIRSSFSDSNPEELQPILYTEKESWRHRIGLLYRAQADLDIKASYTYRETRYTDSVGQTGLRRYDQNHHVKFILEHPIDRHYRLNLEFNTINNVTNYTLADYSKQTVLIGLQYNY